MCVVFDYTILYLLFIKQQRCFFFLSCLIFFACIAWRYSIKNKIVHFCSLLEVNFRFICSWRLLKNCWVLTAHGLVFFNKQLCERKRTLFAYHSSKLSNFTHLLCKSNQMKLEKIVYFSLLVDSSSIENHMKFRFQRGAIPPFYIRSYSALRTSKFLKGNSRVL